VGDRERVREIYIEREGGRERETHSRNRIKTCIRNEKSIRVELLTGELEN
jgi:hypothetical protein